MVNKDPPNSATFKNTILKSVVAFYIQVIIKHLQWVFYYLGKHYLTEVRRLIPIRLISHRYLIVYDRIAITFNNQDNYK